MAEYIKVASIQEFPVGTMKTIRVAGKRIALVNLDNEIFAIDDTCSHDNCSLGTSGFLDGSAVVCGCHGAQFDVTTGDVLSLPATQSVSSYEVITKGEDIYISV